MFMDEQTELNNIRDTYAGNTMVIAFHPNPSTPLKLDAFVCREVNHVKNPFNAGIRRFVIDAYSISGGPIKIARMSHIDIKQIPNHKYEIFVTLDLVDGSYTTQLDMINVTIMPADDYFKLNPVFKTEYDRAIMSFSESSNNNIDVTAMDKLFNDAATAAKFADNDPWEKCDKLPEFITSRTVHEFNMERLKTGMAVEITFNDFVSSLWTTFAPNQTLVGILANVSPSAISVVYVPTTNMVCGNLGITVTFFPYHNINIRILR